MSNCFKYKKVFSVYGHPSHSNKIRICKLIIFKNVIHFDTEGTLKLGNIKKLPNCHIRPIKVLKVNINIIPNFQTYLEN